MWHHDKNILTEKSKVYKKNKTKEILKEIEIAHLTFYANKEESEKKFDEWLENMGHDHEQSNDLNNDNEYDNRKVFNFQPSNSTLESKLLKEKAKSSKGGVEFASSLVRGDLPNFDDSTGNLENRRKSILKRKEAIIHTSPWNYSTKTKDVDYIAHLDDFYPRDIYTCLPVNEDLVLLNQVLKGMSVDEIKKFMRTTDALEKKLLSQQNPSPVSERPVHFRPKNILDTPSKVKSPPEKTPVNLAGLTICNDLNSFVFKEAKKHLTNNTKYSAKLNSIKRQISKSENQLNDQKLEIVEKNFGSTMTEIMKDRHGKLSQRYEKVFIC